MSLYYHRWHQTELFTSHLCSTLSKTSSTFFTILLILPIVKSVWLQWDEEGYLIQISQKFILTGLNSMLSQKLELWIWMLVYIGDQTMRLIRQEFSFLQSEWRNEWRNECLPIKNEQRTKGKHTGRSFCKLLGDNSKTELEKKAKDSTGRESYSFLQ